jgi:hypothetical protein
MPTPSELREESRLLRDAAQKEPDPQARQKLAEQAVELAQLVEHIERHERRS